MNDILNPSRPIIYSPSSFEVQKGNFLLRPIKNQRELEQVYRLTYECYLQQGYCSKSDTNMLVHYPQLDTIPSTNIFVVEDNQGNLIGTISTTLDNQLGLHVDIDFHSETELVRHEGKALASSWRIAIDQSYRSQSQVARLLIDGTVAYWHFANIQTCLMTFNPCHERFYERYINCKILGRNEELNDLENAPAVLMRWDASRCPLKSRLNSIITSNTKH